MGGGRGVPGPDTQAAAQALAHYSQNGNTAAYVRNTFTTWGELQRAETLKANNRDFLERLKAAEMQDEEAAKRVAFAAEGDAAQELASPPVAEPSADPAQPICSPRAAESHGDAQKEGASEDSGSFVRRRRRHRHRHDDTTDESHSHHRRSRGPTSTSQSFSHSRTRSHRHSPRDAHSFPDRQSRSPEEHAESRHHRQRRTSAVEEDEGYSETIPGDSFKRTASRRSRTHTSRRTAQVDAPLPAAPDLATADSEGERSHHKSRRRSRRRPDEHLSQSFTRGSHSSMAPDEQSFKKKDRRSKSFGATAVMDHAAGTGGRGGLWVLERAGAVGHAGGE